MTVRKIKSSHEREVIDALASMALQYLTVKHSGEEYLDSVAMSAGEQALRVLQDYGLVDADSSFRSGKWTEFGKRFLLGRD